MEIFTKEEIEFFLKAAKAEQAARADSDATPQGISDAALDELIAKLQRAV